MTQPLDNRREFVKTSAAFVAGAAAVPYFYTAQRTLAGGARSKNDRLKVGLLGAGGMGVGNMHAARDWCDVVAICDVDFNQTRRANKDLSNYRAATYHDYRDLLERDDLDAIHIATPDHWHTKPLVEAMLAGHDVYCEKPLTLTIDEGKLLRKIVNKTGRILQVGTQQRSTFNLFVKAIALVAEGRVGKIKKLQAAIGPGPQSPALPVAEVPQTLDWQRWIGPAPMADYRFLQETYEEKNSHQ